MKSIRINQQIASGYNPDGMPGTVSTGVTGAAGRAPLPEEIAVAVQTYLTSDVVERLSISAITAVDVDSIKIGTGARGAAGAYVDVGSRNTVTAVVSANGSPDTVDLVLESKNGSVQVQGHLVVDGLTDHRGMVTMGNERLTFETEFAPQYNFIHHGGTYGPLGGMRISACVTGELAVPAQPITEDPETQTYDVMMTWDPNGVQVHRPLFIRTPFFDNGLGVTPISDDDSLTVVKNCDVITYVDPFGVERTTWFALPWSAFGFTDLTKTVAYLWSAVRALEAREATT